MKLSITLEGEMGLNWPRWQRLVTNVEQWGFAGLYRSDHFVNPYPPDLDALEAIVSLTYLATQSQHLHFGTLVAPLSFRDPIMLARQAMALDDLSGGRMILGIGAGWMEREHAMFGYTLGDVATRMQRLEEGLEVMTRLIRCDEPVTFAGRFFQLHEARLLPRPQRATPILVGGNGRKRTLPLVARYAGIWNCVVGSVTIFRECSLLLDDLLLAVGRRPQDVKRTVTVPVYCWRTPAELEARLHWLRQAMPGLVMPTEALLDLLRMQFHATVGTPESVIEQLRAYAAAGAEELMILWFSPGDLEGLALLAEHVMPHVTT